MIPSSPSPSPNDKWEKQVNRGHNRTSKIYHLALQKHTGIPKMEITPTLSNREVSSDETIIFIAKYQNWSQ